MASAVMSIFSVAHPPLHLFCAYCLHNMSSITPFTFSLCVLILKMCQYSLNIVGSSILKSKSHYFCFFIGQVSALIFHVISDTIGFSLSLLNFIPLISFPSSFWIIWRFNLSVGFLVVPLCIVLIFASKLVLSVSVRVQGPIRR